VVLHRITNCCRLCTTSQTVVGNIRQRIVTWYTGGNDLLSGVTEGPRNLRSGVTPLHKHFVQKSPSPIVNRYTDRQGGVRVAVQTASKEYQLNPQCGRRVRNAPRGCGARGSAKRPAEDVPAHGGGGTLAPAGVRVYVGVRGRRGGRCARSSRQQHEGREMAMKATPASRTVPAAVWLLQLRGTPPSEGGGGGSVSFKKPVVSFSFFMSGLTVSLKKPVVSFSFF
jgi:hypothetical protein